MNDQRLSDAIRSAMLTAGDQPRLEPLRFDTWAIVEVMGHKRYAGHVREEQVAGAWFLRLDVPETQGVGAYSKLFGTSAIYAITVIPEEVARELAASFQEEPFETWRLSDELRAKVSEHVTPFRVAKPAALPEALPEPVTPPNVTSEPHPDIPF